MPLKQKIYMSVVVPSGLAKDGEGVAKGLACNQRCPSCALQVSGEAVYSIVNEQSLSPAHTVKFIRDIHEGLKAHVHDGHPFAEVAFHGYEVTTPNQWEWVKEIVTALKDLNITFEFITNGMLLYRHRQDVYKLGIDRITVSVDGNLNAFDGRAYINDMYRGIPNATLYTCTSLTKFIHGDAALQGKIAALESNDPYDPIVQGHHSLAEYYKGMIGVASVIYGPNNPVSRKLGHTNFKSLQYLPETMLYMGLSPWVISPELVSAGPLGGTRHADDIPWEEIRQLAIIANHCGLETYLPDPHGYLAETIATLKHVHDTTQIEDKRFVLRWLAGSGHISRNYTKPVTVDTLRLTKDTENAFDAVGGLNFFPDEQTIVSDRKISGGTYWQGSGPARHTNLFSS